LQPRGHTISEPRQDLGAGPRLAAVGGSGVADLEGLWKLALFFEAMACRWVQARELPAFWLKN
jgi:hypothetical protein